MNFNTIIKDKGDHVAMGLSGVLDEDAVLPNLDSHIGRVIKLDLSLLKSMSSVGIRKWVLWMQNSQVASWGLEGCPKFFIDQLNMVQGFLATNAKVNSFYVPYYSESTSEEKYMLLTRSEHYPTGKIEKWPEFLDSFGHAMEVDVLPERYCRFLNQH